MPLVFLGHGLLIESKNQRRVFSLFRFCENRFVAKLFSYGKLRVTLKKNASTTAPCPTRDFQL